MKSKDVKVYRSLIIINTIASIVITHQIILYNIESMGIKVYLVLFYAIIWYYSLYKIYNFSKIGLKLYVLLVSLGFFLNILSNQKMYGSLYYIMSLFEHIIIGGIIALSYFSKIKTRFK